MSYIAKVYLNKMFPKKGENAIRIEGDYIVVTFVNVINSIHADSVPADLNEHFEFISDDNPIAGKNIPEAFEKVKMVWNGTEYNPTNFLDLKGKVFPTGDKVVFYFPNTVGWAAGEKHKITVKITQDRPITFSITRTVA